MNGGSLTRRSFVVALAVVGLLASAAPADAKVMDLLAKVMDLHRVTIRGSELKQPLVLSQREFGIPRSQSGPRLVAAFGLLDYEGGREARPSGELGVGFEVTYEYRSNYDGEPRFFRVREVLYPYARVERLYEGRITMGPVAFTPPGQTWRMGRDTAVQEIPTGWRAYPRSVVRHLQGQGLPVVETARLNAEPAEVRRSWGWLLTPVLVGLLAISARVYRRRSLTAQAQPRVFGLW